MRVSFGTKGAMVCCGGEADPRGMRMAGAVWRGALALLLTMMGPAMSSATFEGCLLAQAPAVAGSAESADGVLTLHAYENLIQLPVLVLSPHRERLAPIAAERFQVSMDEGPWFRATHARREGDDPIALAILLDGQTLSGAALQAAASAIAALGDGGLRATDSVSVYTRECVLKGSAHPQPGTKEGVGVALAAGFPEREIVATPGYKRPDCKNGIGLWDSLAYVEGTMMREAGRRVVLVVSDRGGAQRNRYTAHDVWRSASAYATTIFGVTEPDRVDPGHALEMLSASSGGMVVASRSEQYNEVLPQVLAVVRGRYIVEFPRASNATAGVHNLRVEIDKGGDVIIRPSGLSVPTADARVMADPATIPNDTSRMPTMGTQRPADSR